MDALIRDYLSSLVLGQPQQFKNMTTVPLFTLMNHGPNYVTLREALEKDLLSVTEVSLGGSVPQLKVVNRADVPVLLVDGEELAGAKQNRVLNTSILLVEKSETMIPVSCTEQGRWSYKSRHFSHSGHIMAHKLRNLKSSTVAAKLKMEAEAQQRSGGAQPRQSHHSYASDQGAVWHGVHEFACHADVHSSTHAMHDVFTAKLPQLDEYLKAFPVMPEQKGLLVLINGKVVGLDLVSLGRAYQVLHPTLVKSFAIDALLEFQGVDSAKPADANMDEARGLLANAMQATDSQYPAIGYGVDHRLEAQKAAGAALVSHDHVIHLALYQK